MMGLALVLGVGLCALIVWDQTRATGGDGAGSPRPQAAVSQSVEPAEPPVNEAPPASNTDASSPAESGATDGEVWTLTM
jgi:hypothetical protein